MNTRILVIDDLRNPRPEAFSPEAEVVVARNSMEGLAELEKGGYSEVFFDHDLGGDDTTRHCVSLLEEWGYFGRVSEIERVVIHTSNSVGGDWIYAALAPYYNTVRVDPLSYFTD